MPHLNARAIEIDPEGMDRLRRVIATAAGGALAYDPDAYAMDGDHRAVARHKPASSIARSLFGASRAQRIYAEPNGLVWA